MNSVSIGSVVLLQPLWLIGTVLFATLAMLWTRNKSSNDWQAVMSPEVFEFLSGKDKQQDCANWLLWCATLVCLCLTQPVIRTDDDDTWRHSIGWVAVIDVSRSMTLNDTVPSRLSAARQSLAVLSAASGARPITMIIYAGDAFLVAPPAFDKSVFNEHAALLEHGVVETEGSNLARALSLATSVVADSGFVASRVFVLTDTGGITASSVTAAAYLAENRHSVDVLVYGNTSTADDDSSQTLVLKPLAEDLATAGGGQAVYANAFGVLDYDQLSLSEQATASTHTDLKALVWKDQSHWLLLLGIPLLLMQFRRERQS